MEVLDNLPHDKVVRAHAGAPWQQVHVANAPHVPIRDAPRSTDEAADLTPLLLATHAQAGHGADARKHEVAAPLSDALIQRCCAAADCLPRDTAAPPTARPSAVQQQQWWQRALDALAGVGAGGSQEAADAQICYLPTGALQLFDAMHAQRPRHHLVAADFAHFAPGDVRLLGANAPIVSTTVRHPHLVEARCKAIAISMRLAAWCVWHTIACAAR